MNYELKRPTDQAGKGREPRPLSQKVAAVEEKEEVAAGPNEWSVNTRIPEYASCFFQMGFLRTME